MKLCVDASYPYEGLFFGLESPGFRSHCPAIAEVALLVSKGACRLSALRKQSLQPMEPYCFSEALQTHENNER